MDKRKIIYYQDELNDEFSTAVITPRKIDGNYRYSRNTFFKRFTHIFWYRLVATPLAFIYNKLKFHHRIIGKEKLSPFKNSGYFIYGNHTQDIGDALMPPFINFPKNISVIVHANNVSMPFLGKITPSLGALPLPDDMEAYKNFTKELEDRFAQNNAIVIYPEAHIWPYYTKIRNFSDSSFQYPIKLNSPVFCFTNTYQKRKRGQKPNIVTYIDGPFYPDMNIPMRAGRRDLRDRVYSTMCERAKSSDIVCIEYIKKEQQNG